MGLVSSYLFVPATRVDRVDKALNGDAHAVIVDLEDGVSHNEKSTARNTLESWTSGREYLLRINPVDSQFVSHDLAKLNNLERLCGIVLAKVESPDQVEYVLSHLPRGISLLALIETASGLLAAPQIARSGVDRLLFGSADYLTDVGVVSGPEVLRYPRACLVVASAAAGLAAPIDGPTLKLKDVQAVKADAQDAKLIGFGGKLCIHPDQVATVNSVFELTKEETEWARRVVSAWENRSNAVFQLDGEMVDAPILRRAQGMLGLR
ncbi:MAG: CoA ester lyase [Ilumatobacteraceae bacterium]